MNQTETVTTENRGRKAGSKNLPIPEAWQGVFTLAGETKGRLAQAMGISYPTLRKAMTERAPTDSEIEAVRIFVESIPETERPAA